MDGHFVPNITIGPVVVKSIRKITALPLDVHLMIADPDKYIPAFVEAGANLVTVHAEATPHLDRTLNFIRSFGVQAGVSLNPSTPVSVLECALPLADLLLIMSVNPGFGGQKFIPYALDKIREARSRIAKNGRPCAISVDGGVDKTTMPAVLEAGADILVAGSAVFGTGNPAERVREMLEMAASLGYHANGN
jgi:ribulose-phosphate 3-epimerase